MSAIASPSHSLTQVGVSPVLRSRGLPLLRTWLSRGSRCPLLASPWSTCAGCASRKTLQRPTTYASPKGKRPPCSPRQAVLHSSRLQSRLPAFLHAALAISPLTYPLGTTPTFDTA